MAFSPRTTGPEQGNLNYTSKSAGGLNPWYVSTSVAGPKWPGCVMPNCTGYATGRWIELGDSRGAALWYPGSGQGGGKIEGKIVWDRNPDRQSSSPSLGAMMCWTNHVAIVEAVHDDGTIDFSWSDWGGTYFRYTSNIPARAANLDGWGSGSFIGYLWTDGSGGPAYVYAKVSGWVDPLNPQLPDPSSFHAGASWSGSPKLQTQVSKLMYEGPDSPGGDWGPYSEIALSWVDEWE